MKRKIGITFLLVALAIVFCIPITFFKDNIAEASDLAINEVDLTLEVDHYRTLKVYNATQKVTFESSNSKVASVSSSGRVTANASGTAIITSRSGSKKIKTKVRVIQINKKSFTLHKGQTQNLTVWGANDTLTFKSSNTAVAKVNKSGKVTAVGAGTATIYATVNNKAIESVVTVVGLNKDSLVLEYDGSTGDSQKLSVIGMNNKASWSSSDTSVATVDKNGKVVARGYGNAVITATVGSTKLTSTVKVLQMSPRYVGFQVGDNKTLKVLGTNSNITWTSKNPSVATVDKNGKVKGISVGDTTIVANVDGRKIEAYISVSK